MQKKRTFSLLAAVLGVLLAALVLLGVFAEKGILMKAQPAWYYATCFSVAAAALLALLILFAFSAPRPKEKREVSLWKRLLFSENLLGKSRSHAMAYAGVAAALCIVTNLFELKFATTQFSLTIVSSMLAGMILGPLLGAAAVFLGDGLGYLVNSMGYPYYWWVALSCACMAVVAGLVMRLPLRGRGGLAVKLLISCVLVLVVCSVGINSTGMYFLGLKLYFPQNVRDAIEARFGGRNTFWIYLFIRFFLLGQIWNSLVNYAVLFLLTFLLRASGRIRFG